LNAFSSKKVKKSVYVRIVFFATGLPKTNGCWGLKKCSGELKQAACTSPASDIVFGRSLAGRVQSQGCADDRASSGH